MNSAITLTLMMAALLMAASIGAMLRASSAMLFAVEEPEVGVTQIPASSPDSVPPAEETVPVTEEEADAVQIPEEGIPYDQPDFTDVSDFKVTRLPEEVRNYLTYKQARLRPGEVGELDFIIDPDYKAVLRVAPSSRGIDISDWPSIYDSQSTRLSVDGTEVTYYDNQGGESLALWSKDGFDYALFIEQTEMGLFNGATEQLVDSIVTEFGVDEKTP